MENSSLNNISQDILNSKKKASMVAALTFFTFVILILIQACNPDTPLPENKFPANKVMSICIDKSGVVWAGTDIGVISFWNDQWTSFDKLNTGEVHDISKQASGSNLWLATSRGAELAEVKLNLITSTTLFTKSSSSLMDNKIYAVVVNSLNESWFATPKGLSIFKENKWYSSDNYGDLVINPVISMGAKSDGWIFTGTTGLGVGRYKYDSDIDGITGASNYNTDWTSLPSDTILSIYVDANNKQWYGTPNGAAFHGDWETKKAWTRYSVSNGLINKRVQAITGDSTGHIWFGTAAGVSYFDGQTWKSYTVADGLLNPSVNDIAIDANGSIWFATNGGISIFDGLVWKSFSKQ